MTFNGEIQLGHLLIASSMVLSVIGAFYKIQSKLDIFQHLLESYNARTDRLEKRHEERLTLLEQNERRLTNVVERIVGQNEERIRWDGLERRAGHDPRRSD